MNKYHINFPDYEVPQTIFWRKRCPWLFLIRPSIRNGNWWECWKLVHTDQRMIAELGMNKDLFKFVHQHNTLACTYVLLVRQSLLQKQILWWNTLSIFLFWLYVPSFYFQLQKLCWKRHFRFLEEVQQHLSHVLKAILEDVFQKCFQMWQKRIDQCTTAKGNYFERANSN